MDPMPPVRQAPGARIVCRTKSPPGPTPSTRFRTAQKHSPAKGGTRLPLIPFQSGYAAFLSRSQEPKNFTPQSIV